MVKKIRKKVEIKIYKERRKIIYNKNEIFIRKS